MKNMPGRLVFLALIVLFLGACEKEIKPTRSECIIGFNLDWSNVTGDRHSIRNSFADRPVEENRIRALVAMMISLDGTRIYFQFKSDCAHKADMAFDLIEFWRSKNSDIPKFSRIKNPIIPSLDTIEFSGPYWRD